VDSFAGEKKEKWTEKSVIECRGFLGFLDFLGCLATTLTDFAYLRTYLKRESAKKLESYPTIHTKTSPNYRSKLAWTLPIVNLISVSTFSTNQTTENVS
jgi:hypothetical protein